MASHSEPVDRAELEERLWKETKKRRTVMLGLVGGQSHHMQPMTAFLEEDGTRGVWFYVKKDNHLLQEAGAGKDAMMCVMADGDHFIACVGGTLLEDHDRERIERFWNPVVAAWYPEGKDDPELTLMKLDPKDAQVWVSPGGALRFGFEIAKANLTKHEPDVGQTVHLTF